MPITLLVLASWYPRALLTFVEIRLHSLELADQTMAEIALVNAGSLSCFNGFL
jgi:hypothetical protein